MKVYNILHTGPQITLAICKTRPLAEKWVEENSKKYKHMKYTIQETEVIEDEDTIINQL